MASIDQLQLAQALFGAVLEAGRIEMAHFHAGVAVETKADRTPVTVADRDAEAVILAALARVAPGVPVAAEEAVAANGMPVIGDRFFLVDPLDGTREFIAGRPEFTVNIGLIDRGRPVFGLVYAPAVSRLFVTLAADNAVEIVVGPDSGAGSLETLSSRRLRTREPDESALTAIASRSHMSKDTETFLARYRISERKTAGSSLKFCLVAKGEADLYPRFGPTCEWDTAAGDAILLAAGGIVTGLDGAPLPYGKADRRLLNPPYVAWGRSPLAPVR